MAMLRASLGDDGEVLFRSSSGGVQVQVRNVCVDGMNDGMHGFHIHESGDTSEGCASMGGHYDPHGTRRHGGPHDRLKHLGDLGNLRAQGGCLDDVTFVASELTLEGIRDRGLVLHEREDDHGRGGTIESHTTGSAGARISCGRIAAADLPPPIQLHDPSAITPGTASSTIHPIANRMRQ